MGTQRKLYVDPDIHLDVENFISNKSAGVNDPPSDYYEAQPSSDGTMTVVNGYGGTKKFAGALVSNKRPLPKWNDTELYPYVSMYIRFKFPSEIYHNIARHELDLKVCLRTRKDPNVNERIVADFSTQWNRDTGQFQIDQDNGPDKIPTWIDTGYVVKDIEPDVWHDLYFNFWSSLEEGVYSVLSIQLDDNPAYMIPESLQRVLLNNCNWEEIASVQVQNEMYEPGHNMILYANILLAWSDEPIDVYKMVKYGG